METRCLVRFKGVTSTSPEEEPLGNQFLNTLRRLEEELVDALCEACATREHSPEPLHKHYTPNFDSGNAYSVTTVCVKAYANISEEEIGEIVWEKFVEPLREEFRRLFGNAPSWNPPPWDRQQVFAADSDGVIIILPVDLLFDPAFLK